MTLKQQNCIYLHLAEDVPISLSCFFMHGFGSLILLDMAPISAYEYEDHQLPSLWLDRSGLVRDNPLSIYLSCVYKVLLTYRNLFIPKHQPKPSAQAVDSRHIYQTACSVLLCALWTLPVSTRRLVKLLGWTLSRCLKPK